MEKSNNWKYKDSSFNYLDNNGSSIVSSEQRTELINTIDSSRKKELCEIFDNGINKNYDRFKKYLHEVYLFLFRELEGYVAESVNCLIIEANIASITITNLILERAIKLALILYEVGEPFDYNDKNILQKYIEANKKYSGKSMEKNIIRCKDLKIFTTYEAKEISDYKLKYRDGFSHFTPNNILKGENSIFPIKDNITELDLGYEIPSSLSIEVRQFADKNAENHLKYILGIVNHLQHKVLEKFRKIQADKNNS